jgi:hypothetical protein
VGLYILRFIRGEMVVKEGERGGGMRSKREMEEGNERVD